MMSREDFAKLLLENNKNNNAVLKKSLQDGFREELQLFKEAIKDMVSNSIKELTDRVDQLESKIKNQNDELQYLRDKLTANSSNSVQLQFDVRRKNILLFKVHENETGLTSLKNLVVKLIRDTADSTFSDADVDCIYRVGPRGRFTRPIKVELQRASKRNLILSLKKKFHEKNIGIAEDLPKEVAEFRKPLYKVADRLRENGRMVQFRKDKFIVDGTEWTHGQIQIELESSRPQLRTLSCDASLSKD